MTATTTNITQRRFRPRQVLGKYCVKRKVGDGAFAEVYAATDTIEGIDVALKIPRSEFVDEELLSSFKREVRMVATLDHSNILPIKNADFIDGIFVVATKLAEETLHDRLRRRIRVERSLSYFEQMIGAVAFAHQANILHCDIKPENLLLFESDKVMLSDFGIAKIARQTLTGSGTGTVGYMAPEQAMGRPSKRSDVFSLGMIMFRMLSGCWPEYPFDWPPKGTINLRRRHVHPDLIQFIRKAIAERPHHRFADAIQMKRHFGSVYKTALNNLRRRR